MTKFKVGDKVKIVKHQLNDNTSKRFIGHEGIITPDMYINTNYVVYLVKIEGRKTPLYAYEEELTNELY